MKKFFSLPYQASIKSANTSYSCLFLLCLLISQSATAELEKFIPFQGGSTEIWQLTDNPAIRQSTNYHNTSAWSPDGRYISIEESVPHSYKNSGGRWISDPKEHNIFVYDLLNDEYRLIGRGINPRWANRHNWLFYIELPGSENSLTENQVIWFDIENGQKTVIAVGLAVLGETDHQDQWLYGELTAPERGQIVRIPITIPGEKENISSNGAHGAFMIPNPVNPVIFYRDDERDAHGNIMPFGGTRFFSNLSGGNVQIASPNLQGAHTSWSSDGTYLLHGGPLLMGRLWNEPFPSNLHVLSHMRMTDVNGGGENGRWVCGSGNVGPLSMVDLRSGDGWNYLQNAASYIHDSTSVSYGLSSQLFDNNAKCSPDGTKVVFESNYDLKQGPVTRVAGNGHTPGDDTIRALSTNGFPAQGKLSISNEIVGYSAKTATSFTGITRNLHNTTSASLAGLTAELIEAFKVRTSDKDFLHEYKVKKELLEPLKIVTGEVVSNLGSALVTSFDLRTIPEDQRGIPALRFIDPEFPEKDSPLIWQRQTDAYVAVIRKPDSPLLRFGDYGIELIPAENHKEIKGYYILKDGVKISESVAIKGSSLVLAGPGAYSAIAVEWSGMGSNPSKSVLVVDDVTQLEVLNERPENFSWFDDRWLVSGEEVSASVAQNAENSTREIVHAQDNTIHREHYQLGKIIERHDLNRYGNSIRRQFYQNEIMIQREYYDNNNRLRSTEHFDNAGYINELIRYNKSGQIISRTLFEGGVPVSHTGVSMLRYGSGTFIKAGKKWNETQAKSN